MPCASPVRPSDQLPLAFAVVVAFVALLEMVEDASAVPVKARVVEVETAPSADGAVMIGADGGVVSVAGALDTDEDDEDESDEDEDEDEEDIGEEPEG